MADFNSGGGTGGENQQAGEMQGGQNSHISYVKHLSSDQADPGSEGQSQDSGFISKIPGGWWTVGIGVATIVIGLVTIHIMNVNASNNAANGTTLSGSSAYYPYSGAGSSGGVVDTTGTVGGAMDSQLSGLLGQEQINNQILQSILGNITKQTGDGSSGTTPPNQVPLPQQFFPWAKGTKGASNNFNIYTTKSGQTLNSLNVLAKWGNLNSINQGGNNIDLYRNNQTIFQQLGITGVNQVIPTGTQISI